MAGKKGRRGWGFVRRLPSRRYQASYVGPDLVRHRAPRTYTSKLDAERWLADERRAIERDEWTPPAQREAERKARGVTLADYGPTWIEQRTKGGQPLKPRTKSHYTRLFDEHIKPKLGKLALKDVTPQAVRDWHARTLADKPTYRAHAYGLLHSMLASAVADELISVNPAQIKGAAKATRKRQPVILDVAEVGQLADAIRPEKFKAFILIAAWCGLRWGELTELRRKDVGQGCAEISVWRAVTHRDKACVIDSPKSGEARKVVVPPHVRPALQHHLKAHVAKDAEALLFPPARGGCHLRDKVFRESYFDRALTEIGRDGEKKPRPTIHDLRHFAGTQTARVGNLVETMGRLGHKTVQASLIYQQIASGRDAEVAEGLSKLAENGVL
ncbi:tyrosine-type recombinase/integrase [Mycolicibacterium elephantis]|uniref:tyrosine-type recombinase/integrase n=1 Tax=Mycolicibacterium elephantis TaxID=81858 RepID=UPI000FE1BEC5|nr:site-specific integrase [Mycolicibacterium elephantis]MCV7221525.1 tyrosine-type recombinase/integrase [Mycolicibacterium elephantis]